MYDHFLARRRKIGTLMIVPILQLWP